MMQKLESAPLYQGTRRVGEKHLYDAGTHYVVMWDSDRDIHTKEFPKEGPGIDRPAFGKKNRENFVLGQSAREFYNEIN